jgi:hypothetical protein
VAAVAEVLLAGNQFLQFTTYAYVCEHGDAA